jgi:NADH:ubiquinone oxidoreductase subunit H
MASVLKTLMGSATRLYTSDPLENATTTFLPFCIIPRSAAISSSFPISPRSINVSVVGFLTISHYVVIALIFKKCFPNNTNSIVAH